MRACPFSFPFHACIFQRILTPNSDSELLFPTSLFSKKTRERVKTRISLSSPHGEPREKQGWRECALWGSRDVAGGFARGFARSAFRWRLSRRTQAGRGRNIPSLSARSSHKRAQRRPRWAFALDVGGRDRFFFGDLIWIAHLSDSPLFLRASHAKIPVVGVVLKSTDLDVTR